MEELKKISYEAGVTTHKDVREAINANVESQNKNNKSYDERITSITGQLGVMNEGIRQNQNDIARDHQTLNTVSANVTKLQSDVSSAQSAAETAQTAAETAQATGTEAKNTANTAQQTAKEVARIQALTPSGTIPFDAVHEDGLTLESQDYDLDPVDLDADVVLGVTVELYPSASTGDKMRAKGVFVANLTLKGTPSSRRALNWKASAKYGVQDSRQYNNATRTGDATGYITDENFGQNGGIVHGNLFWCKADKKVYHYTTSTTNNYGVFVNPADKSVDYVYIKNPYDPDVSLINEAINKADSQMGTSTGSYMFPLKMKTEEELAYGSLYIEKKLFSRVVAVVMMHNSLMITSYSAEFEADSNRLVSIELITSGYSSLSSYRMEEDYDNTIVQLFEENPFTGKDDLQKGKLHNELYTGARVVMINDAESHGSLTIPDGQDPISKISLDDMDEDTTIVFPQMYEQVTYGNDTYKNLFLITLIRDGGSPEYHFNWHPSNKLNLPGSTYYNQRWSDNSTIEREFYVGLRRDVLYYTDDGSIYKSDGSILSKIISPDNSAEELMRSMFLQFDEVQSTITMASDNSMGYDIADPDAADSGITKANIILAQKVTYNGGTRAKGTFIAQFTTASGTKYALNWKHSSKLGLADSRYYNNAGANPFTSGTATDPTKYITDDTAFKSTEFRGIRGENTYLCKGTGAVYVRDTQQTEWYKVVIDPRMWAESN